MIIATRTLVLRRAKGDVKVPIRIHAPEKDRMFGWRCRYSVGWPNRTFKSEGYGHDAVQALLLTCQKIGVEIYVTKEHKSGRLGWLEPGNGYGFPVPKNVQDLLVGDDKEFFA